MSEQTTESLLNDQQQGQQGGAGGTVTNDATDLKPAVWQEQLSADLKGNDLLSGIDNVNDLGAKYIEQAGKLSNSIPKLGEGATEDDVKAHRDALGIPGEAKGYEFTHPEMPEGLDYDDQFEAAAKDIFHKAGITQEGGQVVIDFYNNMVIEAFNQMAADAETARVDTKAALEKDWGDNMKTRVEGAEAVINRFGSEDFKLRLEEKGLAYDPAVYRTFDAIKQVISEDKLMPPPEQGGNTGMDRTKDGGPQLDFSKTMDAAGNPIK